MNDAKEEINHLLEQVYKTMRITCRKELRQIGKVMSKRRQALDYSVWQVGMETDMAFDDIEKMEKAVYPKDDEFDYSKFRRFMLCFFALDELYSVYENNPKLLEFEKLCKLIYQKYDNDQKLKEKADN